MKTTFTMMSFLLCLISNAQNFSGEITYKISIIPKNDTSKIDDYTLSEHGEIAKYLITNKYYKSTYFKDGKFNYSYTYHDDTKRMYDDYADGAYITFRDSRRANLEFIGSKIYKDSIIDILGHKSFLVETETSNGTSKNYYSNDIKVNPEEFNGHLVGNWYQKLKEVNGAILLKTITEHDNYYKIQEVIKIEERIVKKSEFDLPKQKPIAASYSALDKKAELLPPTTTQIKCYQSKSHSVSNPQGEPFKSYVSFFLTHKGEILFVESMDKENDPFSVTSIDIVNTCGFSFSPAEIEGKTINSKVFFPVEYRK